MNSFIQHVLLIFDVIMLLFWNIIHFIFHINSEIAIGNRLLYFFLRLGPAGMKIGQVLSHRNDILPIQICNILSELTNNVPGLTKTDEAYLLKEAKELVKFDDGYVKPLGSGCVSVTYLVQINKTNFVIKIKRPNIHNQILQSFSYVYQLFWFLSALKVIQFNDKLDKIKHTLLEQTNFTKELEELTYFYNKFLYSKKIEIPKPYPIYCNENILTMSYIDGHNIYNICTKDKQLVGHNLWDFAYTSAFVYGHWHADLHKGNILYKTDGRLGIIDFGITGLFKGYEKSIILNYNIYILKKQWKAASRLFVTKMVENKNIDKKIRHEFMIDISNILKHHFDKIRPDILNSVIDLSKCSEKYNTKFNNKYAKFELAFSTLACTMVELGYNNIYEYMKHVLI